MPLAAPSVGVAGKITCMAAPHEPGFVVAVTWTLATPLNEPQLDGLVEALASLEPCVQPAPDVVAVTVAVDAGDTPAAARAGLEAVREALRVLDPMGAPEVVEVVTEVAQWVYEVSEL